VIGVETLFIFVEWHCMLQSFILGNLHIFMTPLVTMTTADFKIPIVP